MGIKSEEIYKSYVDQAKKLYSEINSKQAQIAYLATKVCEIRHGGKSDGIYTVTRFAKDIGMNRKTLSEWVSVYRNVISKLDLEVKDVTKQDWTTASRVMNTLNEEVRVSQALSGIAGRKERGTRKEHSKEKIKSLFNENYNGPSFQKQIGEWSSYIIYIKNNLISKDLSTVSLGSLIDLKENLDKASDEILSYITKGVKKRQSNAVVKSEAVYATT